MGNEDVYDAENAPEDAVDRLIELFRERDFGTRSESVVMGVWFVLGLRVAMDHPEWAQSVLREAAERGGWAWPHDDAMRAESNDIVESVPMAANS